MAQAPKDSGGNGGAEFVRHVVSDPKNVPDVMLLTGYPGASSEEAHERLYLRPDFSSYVDIPRTAILHQAALPKEQDAYGGVTVWVKKDAALQYKMAPAAQALANYFAGAIQAGAQGAGGGAQAGPHVTFPACGHATQHCSIHCPTFNCSLHCATEITPCLNTHANTCHCPVTAACQTAACSQGACTYVGCGASLACTEGLLCAGAAPGGAVAARAAPAARQIPISGTPCGDSGGHFCSVIGPPCDARTNDTMICCVGNWTVDLGCLQTPVYPCISQGGTCATPCLATPACITQAATCNAGGTCATPCLPTHHGPHCHNSIQVTCNPGCRFTNPICQIEAGFGGQVQPQAAMCAQRTYASPWWLCQQTQAFFCRQDTQQTPCCPW